MTITIYIILIFTSNWPVTETKIEPADGCEGWASTVWILCSILLNGRD